MSNWPIRRTLSRSLLNGDYIVVTAGLHHITGNERPYFSVTCDIWEKRGTLSGAARHQRGRDADGGGAAHEVILCAFPELAPVVHVHLADDNGVPMHAASNGWYFYSGNARAYEENNRRFYPADQHPYNLPDHERAARALGIPSADLPANMNQDQFIAFAESLASVWAQQAAEAMAVLESLPE